MNSDISKRISARSLPNRNCARDRATSVFPTPVGPKNRNDPTGRSGFFSPARERRIARAKAEIAGRCDTTRLCSSASMRRSFRCSSSFREVTGMPVQRAMTSSTSSRVTLAVTIASSVLRALTSSYDVRDQSFNCASQSSRFPCSRRTRNFTRAPASSMTSIALSGRNRSGM